MHLTCGAFHAEGGRKSIAIDTRGEEYGYFSVIASRTCSADSTTPCLSDSTCVSRGLGSCSVGSGRIEFDAKIAGRDVAPAYVDMTAAGDVVIDGFVDLGASGGGDGAGGSIGLESTMGAVIVRGRLRGDATSLTGYGSEGGIGGNVVARARTDVDIAGEIDVAGGYWGGDVILRSGRDITITSDIDCSSGPRYPIGKGGNIEIDALGDIAVLGPDGFDKTRISNNGGGRYYHYYGWYSGYGGYTCLRAREGDIVLEEKTEVRSLAGPGESIGGNISVSAYEGLVDIAGEIRAEGVRKPSGTYGGYIELDAWEGLFVRDTALISNKSQTWTPTMFMWSLGPMVIDGVVNARATGGGYYDETAYGGSVYLRGRFDLELGGVIKTGNDQDEESGATVIDVCRLKMRAGGRIDNRSRLNDITVRESMAMAEGSLISSGGSDARNLITYRAVTKPPELQGTIDPPPILRVDSSLAGCPVCGNSEIDFGETCDDGNALAGDGCSDTCHDEACVADTPGFPAARLCDDGDACTIDTCLGDGLGCEHVASCEEGVACTIDACDVDACTHTPDDSACDDDNECTTDICNTVTGCVHANLTGGDCDDDDFCTVAGACASGECRATDASLAEDGKIFVKFNPGADSDKASIKGELPLADLTSLPTDTGLDLRLFDQAEQGVFSAQIPPTFFDDVRGDGTKFRYKRSADSPVGTEGVHSVWIRPRPAQGVAKLKISLKGTDLAAAADQPSLSLSLLFGVDPAVDDCLSMRSLPCTNTSKRTRCKA